MKILQMKRRPRAEVIANFLASGMTYSAAVREYDRLDREDFFHCYRFLLNS